MTRYHNTNKPVQYQTVLSYLTPDFQTVMAALTFLGEPVLSWRGPGRVERVLLFLHGSGDTGPGVAEWLDSLGLRSRLEPSTAVIFPSARPRPYSMYGGEVSSVWHDRRELNISAWEDSQGIQAMTSSLDSFISEICQAWGLSRQNVVMGGFREKLCFHTENSLDLVLSISSASSKTECCVEM